MLSQEKKYQEEVWEEQRLKQLLQQKLDKQEKEMLMVKGQLDERGKTLEDLGLSYIFNCDFKSERLLHLLTSLCP